LGKLLEQSRFFELPDRLAANSIGADRFNYKITVEGESGSHTVEAVDSAVPANLRPLLEWLTRSWSAK
jgi:Emfourin